MKAKYNIFHKRDNGSINSAGNVTIEIGGNPNARDNRDAAAHAAGHDPYDEVLDGRCRRYWAQFVEYPDQGVEVSVEALELIARIVNENQYESHTPDGINILALRDVMITSGYMERGVGDLLTYSP